MEGFWDKYQQQKQQYLSNQWPDFDHTMVGFWDQQQKHEHEQQQQQYR